MSNHTPGPWEVRKCSEGDYIIQSQQLSYLTKPPMFGDGAYHESVAIADTDANARLIAASPEMRLQLMYDRGLIQALAEECKIPVDDVLENIDAILHRINGEDETA